MSELIRFLATGDFQVHAWKQFSITLPNGMNSRLYNCLRVFDIVRREAAKRRISHFLGNGDIFEETDYISVEVYDAVYRKVEKLHSAGIRSAFNVGNHDVSLQSGGRTIHSLRPFRKIAHVLEEPTRLWHHLQVVPYMANPEELKTTIARLAAAPGLVLHCGVQGARTGPTNYLVRNPIHLRDIRPRDFRLVLLSDYHTHQFLRSNVVYLGSPLQHSFGETHRPCIWDVALLDERPWFRLSAIPTDLPRFRRLHATTRKELSEKLTYCKGDYVRIVLPLEAKLTEADVEKIASGVCLYQIERQREEVQYESVHALEPTHAIERYVKLHVSSEPRKERLRRLGAKLYDGSV